MKSSMIFILAIMAIVVVVSGCVETESNLKVVNNNLSVSNVSLVNTTQGYGGYTLSEPVTNVTGSIKNNGSTKIDYVPVNISFYNSNGELNDTYTSVFINLEPGQEQKFSFYCGKNRSSNGYKMVVGDPKTKVTAINLCDALESTLNNYNKTKGPENSTVTIKGTPLNIWDEAHNITADGNYTLFVMMDTGKENVGSWVYQTSGREVSGYRKYIDIAVVYWPEMKIVGWHRIYGTSPASQTTGAGGDIVGEDPEIKEWINSLPKT